MLFHLLDLFFGILNVVARINMKNKTNPDMAEVIRKWKQRSAKQPSA
jgi:hypothetical protein